MGLGLKDLKVIVNGVDVSIHLESFSYKDEKEDLSDSISLVVVGEYERPSYKDEIKVYINDFYCGLFLVQNVKISPNSTNIEATATDFSGALKEEKYKEYKDTSVAGICGEIAGIHGLSVKCEIDDAIVHISQIKKSDLQFLRELAKDYGANFNIKDNTLLFLKQKKEEAKATYKIDEKECETWEIEYTNKTLYKSCRATWHDTKENLQKEQIAGSGEPVKLIQGNYKDEAEANAKAVAMLERCNKGIIKGSLSIYGMIIEAGAKLEFKNQIFHITRVNHSINSSNGWNIDVEFEN